MFVNIPNNYSSMRGELIFEYNSTIDTDLLVEIYDEDLDETMAIKKFYSTSSLKLNATPLLSSKMVPLVEYTATGLSSITQGFPKISLIVESQSSDARRFTYAKEAVEAPIVLTTMPKYRLLSAHESDKLTILVDDESSVVATIEGRAIEGDGTMTLISTLSDNVGGAKYLTINSDDFSDTYQTVRVTIYCDQEQLDQVDYMLNADQAAGYRVAWISSQGSIEHYTFPVIEEQNYLNTGATTYTLRSAYGTAEELEALSEILSSPAIYKAEGGSYSSIEMLTTELTLRVEGALMIATFKISENG